MVVDYDFFFDYKNGKVEDSRNKNGFPEYKNTITSLDSKRRIINDAFGDDLSKLEKANGYRKFFELIRTQHFYSMMYCLEIDLVCSSVAKSKYYDILNIDSGVHDTKIL